MLPPYRLPTVVVLVSLLAGGVLFGRALAPISRTVYATVTDGKGAFIADLTPADLAVKEGGKDRVISRVEVSRTPLRIAVLIEDGLARDSSLRVGVFKFLQRVHDHGTAALFLVGRRNVMVVDYTSDLQLLAKTINDLGMAPVTLDENMAEGVFDAAKNVERIESGRRVIVVLAIERQQESSMSPDQVLDELRKSGAIFYAATLTGNRSGNLRPSEALDMSGLDRILGDGAKQSGGLRQESPVTAGFEPVLGRFADELLHQYAITYELPEGVKPDSRLSLSAKRKGISIRAASRIPDR